MFLRCSVQVLRGSKLICGTPDFEGLQTGLEGLQTGFEGLKTGFERLQTGSEGLKIG